MDNSTSTATVATTSSNTKLQRLRTLESDILSKKGGTVLSSDISVPISDLVSAGNNDNTQSVQSMVPPLAVDDLAVPIKSSSVTNNGSNVTATLVNPIKKAKPEPALPKNIEPSDDDLAIPIKKQKQSVPVKDSLTVPKKPKSSVSKPAIATKSIHDIPKPKHILPEQKIAVKKGDFKSKPSDKKPDILKKKSIKKSVPTTKSKKEEVDVLVAHKLKVDKMEVGHKQNKNNPSSAKVDSKKDSSRKSTTSQNKPQPKKFSISSIPSRADVEHELEVVRTDLDDSRYRLRELTDQVAGLDKEISGLEEKQKNINEKLQPLLLRDEQIAKDIAKLEEKERQATNAQDKRRIEKQRWAKEEERYSFEEKKWEVDELMERLVAMTEERKSERGKMMGEMTHLRHKIGRLETKVRLLDIELTLHKAVEYRDDLKKVGGDIKSQLETVEGKLQQVLADEHKLETDKKALDKELLSITSSVERRPLEQQRRLLESERREIEKNRWHFEDKRESLKETLRANKDALRNAESRLSTVEMKLTRLL